MRSLLVVLCVLAAALVVNAQLNPEACAGAPAATAGAKARLVHYAQQKAYQRYYCRRMPIKAGGKWVYQWQDNASMISISVSAIRNPADSTCWYLISHSDSQANQFFGQRFSNADFQINIKRPAGYKAAGKNWHHGEIEGARFLSKYGAADGDVFLYPKANADAARAVRNGLTIHGGGYDLVGVYPDRPFCQFCAGTHATYGGNPDVVDGSLMPIAIQAKCAAKDAALGKVAAVVSAAQQLTGPEQNTIIANAKAKDANAACCADANADGCQDGADGDADVDEDDGLIDACKKRKGTCEVAGDDTRTVKRAKAGKRFRFGSGNRLSHPMHPLKPAQQ